MTGVEKVKTRIRGVASAVLVGFMPLVVEAGFGTEQTIVNAATLQDGVVYKVPNTYTKNAAAGSSAFSVAENATAVIYIPAGVTLTAAGGNASGKTGAGAGIAVPASSTLIITGGGSLVATGGKAADGAGGSNGGSASLTWDKTTAGVGGAGGAGGGRCGRRHRWRGR